MALEVTPSLVIEDSELEESFVRASGPGGQNVNKVSTAVQLRYDVGRSALDGEVRARLRKLAGSRMTDEDVLVIGDLNSRRGHIQAMEERSGARVVTALVPLSEMFGYVGDLRSKTQGRASYSMQFDSYAEVPRNVAEEIIKKARGE